MPRLTTALAVPLALCVVLISPSAAHPSVADHAPEASGFTITQSRPGTVAADGSFPVTLTLQDPHDVCHFYLYRKTEASGITQDIGVYDGTTATDVIRPEWGRTSYAAYLFDCSWQDGGYVPSREVVASVTDEQQAARVVRGVAKVSAQSGAYRKDALITRSRGARVRYTTGPSFTAGLVVTTGPSGGIGTVTVNGVRRGTIDFYSPTVSFRRVGFTFAAPVAQRRTIDVVQTGVGRGGGHEMFLDALTGLDRP